MNFWLNYNHLYYFKVITDEGSIANASKKLLIGAPALSMQLKQLEDHLGFKLFERSNKKLILTESGKVVFDYATSIFRLGAEMLDHMTDKKIPTKLRFQLGVHHSLPKGIIGKLTDFVFNNHDSQVNLVAGNTEHLMNDLLYHNFDLVVIPSPPLIRDKGLIISRPLIKSKIVFCANKAITKSKRSFPEILDNQKIILPPEDNRLRHDIENFFRENKLSLNMVAECEDTYLQKQMALHGNGIIPIMYDAIKPYLKSHELVVLGELPNVYEEIWIVAMKRKLQNPITQLIFDKFNLK